MSKKDSSKLKATKLLLDILETAWRNYLSEIKRCRTEFSNEAVHDLWIATRRVLVFFQLLNSISPRPRHQKMIRVFQEHLDEFDDLRDTQVILAEISEMLQELPQLHDFKRHQQYMEIAILRSLRKKIKKFNTRELTKRIRKIQNSIDIELEQDLKQKVIQVLDDAFLLAKQRLDWVDPVRTVTIHRVRTAFKSFRYFLEIAHPFVNGFPAENLHLMNNYQSLMEEVQDSDVFMQAFADFSGRASAVDLEPVRQYFICRHEEATSAYMEAMNHLELFWRPAPDQPFPWDKKI